MSFDPESVTPPGARIKVIGVGGGGGNAVNTMIRSGLEGVDFVTANTDVQALRFSLASHKIQVGKELTRGLGAGADPDIGRDAVLEDRHEIQELLTGADMVFITAGMGGGTGTGGASVVAQIARELGALTVAVVTKPFGFEGKRRRKHADAGISRLRECVDTLITIPNQRLLQVASPTLSMINAFKMADDVLVNAVRGISDIINIPGLVNVDFADVKTVMSCMGQALMGIGSGSGEGRAVEAARQAICSPLLEDIDIEGATGILVNITAGSEVTLMEANEACSIIQEAAHEDANFIFGMVIDESLGDQMRVTVIATGFPVDKEEPEADSQGQGQGGTPSRIVHPPTFASRLTSPGLVTTAAKPGARSMSLAMSPLHSTLTTKRPEAARPQPAAPAPQHQVVHPSSPASVREPTPEPTREPAFAATPSYAAPREPVFEAPHRQHAAPTPVPTPPLPVIDETGCEAQELTRWTLGDELFGSDEIPSLAPLSGGFSAAHPDQPGHSDQGDAASDVQGARAYGATVHEPAASAEASVADGLFDAGAEGGLSFAEDVAYLLGEASPSETTDPRAGASKVPAPLESFFDPATAFVASDIDRKIDEALELAERMRSPRKPTDTDDLDVPAFLRNGMKDLPLD